MVVVVAPTPVYSQSQEEADKTVETPFERGRILTQSGRTLETAIKVLLPLVARDPKNADYQLTLGCAYASRLASVAYVAHNAKIAVGAQRMFQKRTKIWQQMQNNPTMPLFGMPQPVLPPFTTTPDDDKELDISNGKDREQMTDLAENALMHLREAYTLSRKFAVKRKVQSDYTCGWGMLLIYRYGREVIKFQTETPPPKENGKGDFTEEQRDKSVFYQAEIVACFKECTDYYKKRADYWQSLAFAYVPDYLVDVASFEEVEQLTQAKVNNIGEAIKCLRQTLSLKRGDPDLLYQAALVTASASPEEAFEFLKQLTANQNQNALNFYLLAEVCLSRSAQLKGEEAVKMREEAIAFLEKGNRATEYRCTPMILPVPRLLQSAWSYHLSYGFGYDKRCFDSLIPTLISAANEEKRSGAGDHLIRIGVAMMEMGLKALHNYQGNDLDSHDLRTQSILYSRAFNGFLCCAKAHKFIQSAAELSASASNLSLATQYTQYEAYWRAWDAALTQ